MILNNGDFRVLAQELSPVSKAQRGENTRGVSSEAGRRPPSASASLSRQDPSPSGVGGDKSIARYTMIYLDNFKRLTATSPECRGNYPKLGIIVSDYNHTSVILGI